MHWRGTLAVWQRTSHCRQPREEQAGKVNECLGCEREFPGSAIVRRKSPLTKLGGLVVGCVSEPNFANEDFFETKSCEISTRFHFFMSALVHRSLLNMLCSQVLWHSFRQTFTNMLSKCAVANQLLPLFQMAVATSSNLNHFWPNYHQRLTPSTSSTNLKKTLSNCRNLAKILKKWTNASPPPQN